MKFERLGPPSARPWGQPGFARHDCFLTVAILGIALAVVLPQFAKHGLLGGLVALLMVLAVLGVGLAVLLGLGWLVERIQDPGSGWLGKAMGALGLMLRFLLFGALGSGLASALMLWHGLTPAAENAIALGAGALGGATGWLLHKRLGPKRFWPTFGRFCWALLGSLFGGLLGILGPGNWGVDIGVLAPLLVFALLAANGRILPPRGDADPGPSGSDLACPKCGGPLDQTDKNTFTGVVWREFTCRSCGHIVDVNEGEALWHVLHEAAERPEREHEEP